MRLFIALYFEATVVAKLSAIQEDFKAHYQARYVPKNQLHMTLHFFGDVESSKAAVIKNIVKELPFTNQPLHFEKLDAFQRPNGKILYLKVNSETLINVEKILRLALKKQGFYVHQKTFKPHITLARNLHIPNAAFKSQQATFTSFQAKPLKIALIKSTLTPKGALHTPIFERQVTEKTSYAPS